MGMKSMISTDILVIKPAPGSLSAFKFAKKNSIISHTEMINARLRCLIRLQTNPKLASTMACIPRADDK